MNTHGRFAPPSCRAILGLALAGGLGLASGAGCTPETNVNPLQPEIAVAPEALAFGEQAVLYEVSEQLFITNAGRMDLEVSVDLQDPESVYSLEGEPEATLGPDETWTLPVIFLPETFIDYEASLTISSTDPERPVIELPITGEGVPQPTPDIAVDPESIDFGKVSGTATAFLTIENTGDADLHIDSAEQTGSGAFVLSTDPTGATVVPGGELPVLLTYTPTSDAGDSGTLLLSSDDPDEAEVEVVLLGNGGGKYEYPVAVVDCPGEVDPPTFVKLDGSESYDPQGNEPLQYVWTLIEVPDLSTAYLDGEEGASVDLWADIAGDYRVQLAVVNSLGVVSAPAVCALDSRPSDNIHVELLWNTAQADLDLHLRQDGEELFAVPGDCSYCNPNPDWGSGSLSADDPRHDLDDQEGYGPENIVIEAPATDDYRVAVHYWDDHGDDAVTATLRVYLVGELAFEETMVLERNEVWDAALVEWPDATVVPLTGEPYEAPTRGCD